MVRELREDEEVNMSEKTQKTPKPKKTKEELALKALENLEDPDAQLRKRLVQAVKSAAVLHQEHRLRQLTDEVHDVLKKYVNGTTTQP